MPARRVITPKTIRIATITTGPLRLIVATCLSAPGFGRCARLRNWNPLLRQTLGALDDQRYGAPADGPVLLRQWNTSTGSRRADYVGGSLYPDNQDINNWLNKAAFAAAPNNRRGNSGVGTVVGPGLQSYNLSVSKTVSYRERYNLKLQVDGFNAANLANFSGLDTTVTNSSYGRLSSAYAPGTYRPACG
jgi:hypothetical protein